MNTSVIDCLQELCRKNEEICMLCLIFIIRTCTGNIYCKTLENDFNGAIRYESVSKKKRKSLFGYFLLFVHIICTLVHIPFVSSLYMMLVQTVRYILPRSKIRSVSK